MIKDTTQLDAAMGDKMKDLEGFMDFEIKCAKKEVKNYHNALLFDVFLALLNCVLMIIDYHTLQYKSAIFSGFAFGLLYGLSGFMWIDLKHARKKLKRLPEYHAAYRESMKKYEGIQ